MSLIIINWSLVIIYWLWLLIFSLVCFHVSCLINVGPNLLQAYVMFKDTIILHMAYTITIAIASTAGYIITVIHKPDSYAVSPLKHAVKSNGPASQLPIFQLRGK